MYEDNKAIATTITSLVDAYQMDNFPRTALSSRVSPGLGVVLTETVRPSGKVHSAPAVWPVGKPKRIGPENPYSLSSTTIRASRP